MKIAKTIVNILYWIVILFMILIASSVIISRFDTPLGVRLFAVTSGSMEPAIKTGSIVIVKSQNTYAINDIVTYKSGTSLKNTITHRIVGKAGDSDLNKPTFLTKGDANNAPDMQEVAAGSIVGKVVLTIPFAGYPVEFVQTQMGFIALIIIPATIIILSEVWNIKNELVKITKKKNQKKNEDHEAE